MPQRRKSKTAAVQQRKGNRRYACAADQEEGEELVDRCPGFSPCLMFSLWRHLEQEFRVSNPIFYFRKSHESGMKDIFAQPTNQTSRGTTTTYALSFSELLLTSYETSREVRLRRARLRWTYPGLLRVLSNALPSNFIARCLAFYCPMPCNSLPDVAAATTARISLRLPTKRAVSLAYRP